MIQAGNSDPRKKNKRASRKEEAKVRYNSYVLLLIDPTEKSVQTAVATTRATRVCLCTDDTEGGRDGGRGRAVSPGAPTARRTAERLFASGPGSARSVYCKSQGDAEKRGEKSITDEQKMERTESQKVINHNQKAGEWRRTGRTPGR